MKNAQLDFDHDIHPCWSNSTDVDIKDVNFDVTGPSLHGVVSHVQKEASVAHKAHRLPRIEDLVSRGSWPWFAMDNAAPTLEDWTDAVMKQVATDSSLHADDLEDIFVEDNRGTEALEVVPEDPFQRRRWLLGQLEPLTHEMVNQILGNPMTSEEFQGLTNSAVEQMEIVVHKMERAREARPPGKRLARGKSAREKHHEERVRGAKRKKKTNGVKGKNAPHAVTRLAVDGVSGNSEDDQVSFGRPATPRRQTGRDTVPTRTLQQALSEHQETHGGCSNLSPPLTPSLCVTFPLKLLMVVLSFCVLSPGLFHSFCVQGSNSHPCQ